MEYDINLVEVLMRPTQDLEEAVCRVMKYFKCDKDRAVSMVNEVMAHYDMEAQND